MICCHINVYKKVLKQKFAANMGAVLLSFFQSIFSPLSPLKDEITRPSALAISPRRFSCIPSTVPASNRCLGMMRLLYFHIQIKVRKALFKNPLYHYNLLRCKYSNRNSEGASGSRNYLP